MKIDRRLLTNFDWILILLVLLVNSIGILNLYSTGFSLERVTAEPLYIKQIYWLLIGLSLTVITFSIDYRLIVRYAYIIYLISIVLLFIVFIYGKVTNGSQRWIVILGFSFQSSELMKLTIIIALTKYLSDKVEIGYSIRNVLVIFFIIVIPFFLILTQPDLGTALFLLILLFSMIIFLGIKKRTLIFSSVPCFVLAPLCWLFLKDYQKERILTFLNPERDPLGSGYNIIQSIIAVGSGGFWGKGFLKGTQSQLKFLPEQQTDFVFSVFAEEWGFAGVLILLFLFISLIMWGYKIARNSRDLSGTLLAYGVTTYIFFGVFINIGMVLGMLPVVGIPLPFLSYGGSSMVVLMMGIGLLMNVSMRRFILQS